MGTDRWHGRRPEGARGSSVARLAGYRRHFGGPGGASPKDSNPQNGGALVDEAMRAALAGENRDDATFGDYAPLVGFCRSSVMQEGRLLEMAIEQAVQRNSDLKLLPTQAMPIVPAAQEMLKRTPPDEIKGVRFPSRVHATESYKPDLFVVNQIRHSGLILDVKRNLGSYRPQEVDRLRFRMLAVAAIASEWVAEHQGPLLVKIETAIIDGADEVSDPERGVFRLSEIDHLLGSDGAAESIARTRAMFAERVQAELRRRCRDLFQSDNDSPGLRVVAAAYPGASSRIADDGEPHPWGTTGGAARFGYARRPGLL